MAQQTQAQQPTQSENKIPEGFEELSPLDMNNYTFNARRTVITPELLAKMAHDKDATSTS